MCHPCPGMRSLQTAQREQRVQRRGHAQRVWKPLRHRQHSMRCTIASKSVLYQLTAVHAHPSKHYPQISSQQGLSVMRGTLPVCPTVG